MVGVEMMARPKTKAAATVDEARTAIVHLKGSTAYSEWLDGIHKKTHIPKAAIMRLALELWAKTNGHPAPPEA
jgi:hypothetical protein